MEMLPLELVNIIALKLTAKDLAACCATSHGWRNLFNQDLFWKHHSNKEVTMYLTRAHSVVEPAFVSPEVEGSGLNHVCRQRMNYMREAHLLNNWRSGRFRKEKLEGIPVIAPDFIFDMFTLFYQQDFIIGLSFQKIEVWDVRCDPIPYIKDPCCLLPNWSIYYAFLCEDRLVVVQHLAVQVFQINLLHEMWPPEHTFFFDKDEPTDYITASNEIQNYTSRIFTPKCCLIGKYLIAINTQSDRRLHIWDVVNCVKVKKEKLKKMEEWRFFEIKESTTSVNDIIVKLYFLDEERLKVVVYSLLTFTYYPCVFHGVGYCNLHEDKIVANILVPYDYWLISNYTTGELIHRVEIPSGLSFRSFEVFDNKLIYISNAALNCIDLTNGEIRQFLDAGRKIKNFERLANKFICMEFIRNQDSLDRDFLASDCCPKEVWEICETPKRLAIRFNLPYFSFIKTNTTMTKLIVEQQYNVDVTLISLW